MPMSLMDKVYYFFYGGGGINFLFRDDFVTDDAAPLTDPRTAEPGLGTWDVTELDGSFAISGGRLDYVAQTTPVANDLKLYNTNTLNRDNIALVMATIDIQSDFVDVGEFFGLSDSVLISISSYSLFVRTGELELYPLKSSLEVATNNDSYFLCAVGDVGYCYRLRGSEYSLLFVIDISTLPSDVYAIFSNRNSTGSIDSIRLASLAPSLFAPAIDIASPQVGDGSVSGGDPALPDGDFVIQFTFSTLGTVGEYHIPFRYQDALNYWYFDLRPSGSYRLYEVIDGAVNLRSASGNVLVGGEVMTFIADGTNISGYNDSSLGWGYSSANNFLRRVDWEIVKAGGNDSAISDLKVWKRYARVESGLGSELVVDGDMEAVGVADWNAGNSATLTKETTDPYEGTQILRVARNGVNAPRARQLGILSIGTLYRLSGFARSDGNAVPRVINGSKVVWVGTVSTSWQEFDVFNIQEADTHYQLESLTSIGTEYCEFDNVSVKEVNFSPDALGTKLNQVVS